jgi:hypothetical protein
MSSETSAGAAASGGDPRPATVTFVTTEHFTLQGTRAAIAESTGQRRCFSAAMAGFNAMVLPVP